jgi:hypothetical protein
MINDDTAVLVCWKKRKNPSSFKKKNNKTRYVQTYHRAGTQDGQHSKHTKQRKKTKKKKKKKKKKRQQPNNCNIETPPLTFLK